MEFDASQSATAATRTLRRLWRVPGAAAESRPGPRPTLTLDAVVDAAIAVADANPGATPSIRAIAGRLGCTPMAIYTYAADRRELLELMYDRVHGELVAPDAAGWRDRVAAWAHELLDLYVRHRWIREVPMSHAVLGPNEQAALEGILDALAEHDLPNLERAAIASALITLARGSADTIAGARTEGTGEAARAAWAARSAAQRAVVPDFELRFPRSSALGRPDGRPSRSTPPRPIDQHAPVMERAARLAFASAIALLLDGAEAR